MTNNFYNPEIKSIEMGVCKDTENEEGCFLVPIDDSVRLSLVSMLHDTYDQLEGDREEYELTQKYGAKGNLVLSTSNPASAAALELYAVTNLPTNPYALDSPEDVVYYFAFFRTAEGSKVLGVRRATQFKSILKARNRLLQMIDETLRSVDEPIFRLDVDFDYLIEPEQILILRPSGFEYTAGIEEYVAQAILANIADLGAILPFVDFEALIPFVQSHKRAARTIAALRSRADLAAISRSRLRAACKVNNVEVRQRAGKLLPLAGNENLFLQVLDRRLYTSNLIDNQSERYEAANRHRT